MGLLELFSRRPAVAGLRVDPGGREVATTQLVGSGSAGSGHIRKLVTAIVGAGLERRLAGIMHADVDTAGAVGLATWFDGQRQAVPSLRDVVMRQLRGTEQVTGFGNDPFRASRQRRFWEPALIEAVNGYQDRLLTSGSSPSWPSSR